MRYLWTDNGVDFYSQSYTGVTREDSAEQVFEGQYSLKVVGTEARDSDFILEHAIYPAEDWSTAPTIRIPFYGSNTGKVFRLLLSSDGWANWSRWDILDSFYGWREIVIDLHNPNGTSPTPCNLTRVSGIQWLAYLENFKPFTLFLDAHILDTNDFTLHYVSSPINVSATIQPQNHIIPSGSSVPIIQGTTITVTVPKTSGRYQFSHFTINGDTIVIPEVTFQMLSDIEILATYEEKTIPPPPPPTGKPVDVYAHYGLWDRTPWSGGNWVKWDEAGHKPDTIINSYYRDTICGPATLPFSPDYPFIGLYDLGEVEVHRWNIRLMKSTGIKAVWGEGLRYLYGLNDYIYKVAFHNLMVAAEAENFKVAMFVWAPNYASGDVDSMISDAIAVLSEWKNSLAYLRIDGKPVYVLNRLGRWPSYGWFTTDDMTRLASEVETAIGEEVYWIYETEAWAIYPDSIPEHWWSHPDIDAFFLYIGYYEGGYQFGGFTEETWMNEIAFCKDKAHQYGKKFYHPLTPGFDNRGWGKSDYVSRQGGLVCQRQINALLASDVDGVMLCNWNDWGEQTEFMPSLIYWNDWTSPYQYLALVTQLTGKTFRIPKYQPVETIDPIFQPKFLELIEEYPPTPTSPLELLIRAALSAATGVGFILISL